MKVDMMNKERNALSSVKRVLIFEDDNEKEKEYIIP